MHSKLKSLRHSNRARQGGFTMIEMMVAMTLSLILLAGVLSVVYSSKITFFENERVSRLQESGRAAFDIMLRDLRGAGYFGCAQPISGLATINNVLTNSTSLLWNLAEPLQGYEGTSGTFAPALDPVFVNAIASNDVIAVRSIRATQPAFRSIAPVSPVGAFTVMRGSAEDVQPETPMIISDCEFATIFVATAFNGAGTQATISHGIGTTPGNTSDSILATFRQGAQVSPIETVYYYIRNSGSGTAPSNDPALWRPSLWRGVSGLPPVELISGVEGLELQYGIAPANSVNVTQYVDANAVVDWGAVVSVRIALLIRSAEPTSPEIDNRTYTLINATRGPFADRYERTLFTTTVTLRNRTG